MARKKSLIIVESPTKVKTLGKFLRGEYDIKASVGHVKDLPKDKLGVDVKQGFKPQYKVISGKEKVLRELKAAAERALAIYLAPDPDREGEAIAWHIMQELRKVHKGEIFRINFNEITPRAVAHAIESPGSIDTRKVDAQQTRRILDRLVGYKLSPLLWDKVRRGLSAGRVQSVALRLVVEREREIEAFRPREYWTLTASLEAESPPPFEAKLHEVDGERAELSKEEEARSVMEELEGAPFRVERVEQKRRRRHPVPPFITSTLQQEASRKLAFSARKTMRLAQGLYEGVELGPEGTVGLITYMRTDSVRTAPEALSALRGYIREHFGDEYLPSAPNRFRSRKGAQEAHEAIRPTELKWEPEAIASYLSPDQLSLYRLIWNRFLASQMPPALYDQTTADIKAARFLFRATGSVLIFPGFTRLYVEGSEEAEGENGGPLPPLSEGQLLTLRELLPKQHFTQPPPRYSEASLVKALEEKGIGRPSTYAAILSTLQDRHYVGLKKKRFHPTELGCLVSELLVKSFPDLLNVEFTAQMEGQLDAIEEGNGEIQETLRDFYSKFSQDLERAQVEMKDVKRSVERTNEKCPNCGEELLIRWGRYGKFVACSGYPSCNYTRPLADEVEVKEDAEPCERCGSPMVERSGRRGRFLACSAYPQCKNTRPLGPKLPCPAEDCTGLILLRRSKAGRRFWGCSRYPECTYATSCPPVATACPNCGWSFMLRRGRKDGRGYLQCPREGCQGRVENTEDAGTDFEK